MNRLFLSFIFLYITFLNASSTEWNGEVYNKNSCLQHYWAEKVFTDLDKKVTIPKGGLVLDIGCGDLVVTTQYILPFTDAKKIVAFDPNEAMLEMAQKNKPKNDIITIQKLRVEDLKEMNTYDCVTCFSVLQWVNDKDLAIKNIANALKPGGMFICFCTVLSGEPCLYTARQTIMKNKKWSSYFDGYQDPSYLVKPLEIQNLLTKHDLALKQFASPDVKEPYANNEKFYLWIFGWSQFKEKLGKFHKEFWMECITEYRRITDQSLQPDSKILFTDYVLEVAAVKAQVKSE